MFVNDSRLRDSICTDLFVAHRRESFVLDDGTAIPHVACNHRTTAGWFRSVYGLVDPGESIPVKTISFAIAPDPLLKHVVALASAILRDKQFEQEFTGAETGQSLARALATAFERQTARTVDTSRIPEERANLSLALGAREGLILYERWIEYYGEATARAMALALAHAGAPGDYGRARDLKRF